MIKAIIFDCFGVVRQDTLFASYERLGGDVKKDREFIIKAVDDSSAGKIPSSVPLIAKKLGVEDHVWAAANQEGNELNQELLNYILNLRKKYKTAMLSNIGSGGLEDWFEPGLLDLYFDVTVGSGDIGFAKPEARSYEITADKLGVRTDECVFIDDRERYVEGAIAVGMQAILYTEFLKFKKDLEMLIAQ